MLCPRDTVVCNPIQLEDVQAARCPTCYGVWVDAVAMRSLITLLLDKTVDEQSVIIKLWEAVDGDGKTLPPEFWREDTLICPNDQSALKKHYFAGTMIGLDHCVTCRGYWIDGDELPAIAQHVQADPVQDEIARGFAQVAAQPINQEYRRSGSRPVTVGDSLQSGLLNMLALLLLRSR